MDNFLTMGAGCVSSALPEDSGNCRQSANSELSLHLLSDSVFSEQQKLRLVLDWTQHFLSSDSHDGLKGGRRGSSGPSSLTEEMPECIHRKEKATKNPTLCKDKRLEIGVQLISHQMQCTGLSENQTSSASEEGATGLDRGSHWRNKEEPEANQSDGDTSGLRAEESTGDDEKENMERSGKGRRLEEVEKLLSEVSLRKNKTRSTKSDGQMEKKHLKMTVHEQNQPFADELGQNQLIDEGGFAKKRKNRKKIRKKTVKELSSNVVRHQERSEIGNNPGAKVLQDGVKGHKKKDRDGGGSSRVSAKSRVSLSSLADKEVTQRLQSSGTNKQTKIQTPEERIKPTSALKETHTFLPQTETHTLPLPGDEPGSSSPVSAVSEHREATVKYKPAGVPVCGRWLCLPDEVWLSILSLLSVSDLYRAMQVCSRLHTLASDHTLWKYVSLEKANVTELWLVRVGQRRPRRLCLYSCSEVSLTHCGLRTFFTLCGNSLEEVKVMSCAHPSLHGDRLLPLIGRLCERVTSVDVRWSRATDAGVKALADCCPGMKLRSVVLNGCHFTDVSLMKLVMRHEESLCRLEVFGCHLLTPSCLQTVYQTCPGLQHLNIGHVPKVDSECLTVMTSHLRRLVSLNLTGLKAVTDATMETLLLNCVELQSLILSSCHGVTDLTLHSISKHTPCIKSLNVSRCRAVTDAGVQSLALGCRRLQQLNLSSTSTGNRGVSLLASYCSLHLHTVNLSFCFVTSENILKLCRRCTRLKELHLYGFPASFTERELRDVNANVRVFGYP